MCDEELIDTVESPTLFMDNGEIRNYMIGHRLCVVRAQKGMTRDQLAKAVGISPISISFYEENKWRPGAIIISRMAKVLDTPLGDIIGYDCQTVTDDHGDLLYLKKTGNGHYAVLAKCEKHTLAG